ncbi:MAG: DNA cytosine methyltransferase, partial [Bacteroidales bacterium]|nr:DNA cytosine methyltransferase [Bacteroidales bacterium]
MKNKYNAISLFSGAMGLDLGIEAAGFDIKVCVEMDHWAAETIRINTSIPVIERDINDVSSEDILKISGLKKGNIDLVVGGPPCQAFSTAGKQRGFSDIRGGCIIQFIRVVSDLKPKYFILENVRGILSAKLNAVPEAYKEYDSIKMESGSV